MDGLLNALQGWISERAAAQNAVQLVDTNGETALHRAAKEGVTDLETVIRVQLSRGLDLDARCNAGRTPILWAVENNHPDTILALLAGGCSVNATDTERNTPLHKAACAGHVKAVDVLLSAKADPIATEMHQTSPLHLAARAGHARVIEMLLEAKADVHTASCNESALLHLAAGRGEGGTTKMLLAANADKLTALHEAARAGHEKAVELLLAANADLGATNMCQLPSGSLDSWARMKFLHETPATPLHLAARQGHERVMEILLEAKADVCALSNNQSTPLHFAAGAGKVGAVKMLLKAKADARAKVKPIWVEGFAELESTWNGETALDWAWAFRRQEVVKILERVTVCETEGSSAFHAAALDNFVNKMEEIQAFILLGCDVNGATIDGITPLHAAVSSDTSSEEVVKALVAAKANVNAQRRDQHFFTPLHMAARAGRTEVVRTLLYCQADWRKKDWLGRTALDVAVMYGNPEVAEMLEMTLFDRKEASIVKTLRGKSNIGLETSKLDPPSTFPAVVLKVSGAALEEGVQPSWILVGKAGDRHWFREPRAREQQGEPARNMEESSLFFHECSYEEIEDLVAELQDAKLLLRAPIEDTRPVESRAVSVMWVNQVVPKPFGAFTTRDFVEFVKRVTAKHGNCRFIDLIPLNYRAFVPLYFVSHSWDTPILSSWGGVAGFLRQVDSQALEGETPKSLRADSFIRETFDTSNEIAHLPGKLLTEIFQVGSDSDPAQLPGKYALYRHSTTQESEELGRPELVASDANGRPAFLHTAVLVHKAGSKLDAEQASEQEYQELAKACPRAAYLAGLWIDCLAVSQHAGQANSDDLKGAFSIAWGQGSAVISAIRYVFFCPRDGNWVRRCWCLYEAALGSQYHLEAFGTVSTPHTTEEEVASFYHADLQAAEASHKADEQAIKELVPRVCGSFHKANRSVREAGLRYLADRVGGQERRNEAQCAKLQDNKDNIRLHFQRFDAMLLSAASAEEVNGGKDAAASRSSPARMRVREDLGRRERTVWESKWWVGPWHWATCPGQDGGSDSGLRGAKNGTREAVSVECAAESVAMEEDEAASLEASLLASTMKEKDEQTGSEEGALSSDGSDDVLVEGLGEDAEDGVQRDLTKEGGEELEQVQRGVTVDEATEESDGDASSQVAVRVVETGGVLLTAQPPPVPAEAQTPPRAQEQAMEEKQGKEEQGASVLVQRGITVVEARRENGGDASSRAARQLVFPEQQGGVPAQLHTQARAQTLALVPIATASGRMQASRPGPGGRRTIRCTCCVM